MPRPPYASGIRCAMVPSGVSAPPADVRLIRIPVRFPHVRCTPTQSERYPPIVMSVPQVANPIATGMPDLPMTLGPSAGSRSSVASLLISSPRPKLAAAISRRYTSAPGRAVGRRFGTHRPLEWRRAVRTTTDNLRFARFARQSAVSSRIKTLDPCRLSAR